MTNEINKPSIGKRKSAIARIKLIPGNGNIIINSKNFEEYLQYNPKLIKVVQSSLSFLELEKNYDVIVQSYGGGLNGQSEAIKLGIARALYKLVNEADQRKLKTKGFLTRNATKKERRKYGLKKARKASQFSKR